MGLDGLDIDLVQLLHEKFTVFRIYNRLHRRTEYLDSVFFKYSALVKLHSAIQRSLASECQQNPLRGLLLDDFLDKERRHRKEIYLVGDPFGSLDSSDVRVDQDCLDTFFFQSLQSL